MRIGRSTPTRTLLIALIAMLAGAHDAFADDVPLRDSLGRDYFVYAPAKLDPKKTYWLVVGVHGYGGNGKGAAGMGAWARNGDCIVVGPSFPNEGYQLLQKEADDQLIKVFDLLKKQYTLHPKMFVYGFSGGAQFAHRFMMKHPAVVAGCSAHSGGSWATGEQWMSVNPEAAGIPLVISCGEADTGKMHASAPFGRLEWAKAFEKQLVDGGFCYEAKYWPKVGHAAAPGVAKMTDECYRLATAVAPKVESAIADARKLIDAGNAAAARTAVTKARSLLPKPTGDLSKRFAEQLSKALKALETEIDAAPKEKK